MAKTKSKKTARHVVYEQIADKKYCRKSHYTTAIMVPFAQGTPTRVKRTSLIPLIAHTCAVGRATAHADTGLNPFRISAFIYSGKKTTGFPTLPPTGHVFTNLILADGSWQIDQVQPIQSNNVHTIAVWCHYQVGTQTEVSLTFQAFDPVIGTGGTECTLIAKTKSGRGKAKHREFP